VFVDHGLETTIVTSLQGMSEGMASDPIWMTSPEELALGFEQKVSTCGLFVVGCRFAMDDKQLTRAQR